MKLASSPCSLQSEGYMAVAAEQLNYYEQPTAIAATDLSIEFAVRQKARELVRTAGTLALVGAQSEMAQEPSSPASLLDALHMAAEGDAAAVCLIDESISTDYVERSFKAGALTEVKLHPGEHAGLGQHGQSLDDVHVNANRFMGRTWQMRELQKAEARNKYRQDMLYENGSLKDNYMVVFSCVPDNMTPEELEQENFFLHSMTCSIQATTEEHDTVKLDSAFVAGVKSPDGERHDVHAIKHLMQELGVDFASKSTLQILDTPVLIPKHLMPNGVVDIVKLFDTFAGTFFGEDKPVQDYVDYRNTWRQRQAKLQPMIQSVRRQLIAERHSFRTPTDATKRLGKLTEKYGVYQAVKDVAINPLVFGPEAAGHIEQARLHAAQGNSNLSNVAIQKAEKTAKSSSCPGDIQNEKNKQDAEADGTDNQEQNETQNDESDSKSGKIRCIKCRETVEKKDVVQENSWRCPHCKYEIDICDGKVLHESEPPEKPKTKPKNTLKVILGLAA